MNWVQLPVSSGQNLDISTWLRLDVALSYYAELGFPEALPSRDIPPSLWQAVQDPGECWGWVGRVFLNLCSSIAPSANSLTLPGPIIEAPPFPGAGSQLDLNFQSSCKDCSKVNPEKTICLPPSPSLSACSVTFLSFWIFTCITQNTTFKCTSRWPLHWFT